VRDHERGADGALPPVRKRLGQHFLSDPRLLGRIADALALTPEETVIEIGAGRGALTERLRERAARVIAIELDRALAALLRQRYAGDARVTVVEGDVLDLSLAELAAGPYALAGNVPYYITTPILFHALTPPRPSRAVLLVQREVAERMSARPGTRAYGALSANLQALTRIEMLFIVPAGAFYPPPSVDGAVVRITPLDHPLVAPELEARYRAFVQEAFALRRKQMRRVLRTITGAGAEATERMLAAAGIAPTDRPEAVTPLGFARLLEAIDRLA
jgi:16S rRNA (adenine1518-N6/adenine1519-N6)-dimethyltransferase